MPIPADSCPDGVPPDVCCDTFALIGERVRTVAFEGLLACLDESCASREFRSFTTFGPRIEDLLGESLINTLTSVDQRIDSRTRLGNTTPIVMSRLTWELELRENGWPQARATEDGLIETADWNAVNSASIHMIGHGEAMWRALVDAAACRGAGCVMFPHPLNRHVPCGGVAVGPLTPVGPQAFQAAWRIIVTTDVMMGALQ